MPDFFGYGNESTFDADGKKDAAGFNNPIDFYRLSYERIQSYLYASHELGGNGVFRLGADYLKFQMQDDVTNKFINSAASEVDQSTLYQNNLYLGIRTELEADTRDHSQMPTQGVFAHLGYTQYYSLQNRESNFNSIDGEFNFLLSTRIPSKLTIANRIGGQIMPVV